MDTLLFQAGVSLLALLFGALALGVGRSMARHSSPMAVSWSVAGAAFTIGGVGHLIQMIGAIWAFTAGPDSAVWEEYIRWAPGGNHGRSFLRVATGVLLIVAAVNPSIFRRRPLIPYVSLTATIIVGSLVGSMEGPLREAVHYTNAAVVQVVEVVSILLALFVGVTRNSMDRILFAVLAVYVFRQALNVLSLSAFAWMGTAGAWAPNPIHIQVYGIVGYLAMSGLAFHALRLTRRGSQLPGLLGPAVETRSSLLG